MSVGYIDSLLKSDYVSLKLNALAVPQLEGTYDVVHGIFLFRTQFVYDQNYPDFLLPDMKNNTISAPIGKLILVVRGFRMRIDAKQDGSVYLNLHAYPRFGFGGVG